jgi:hypothetical protein
MIPCSTGRCGGQENGYVRAVGRAVAIGILVIMVACARKSAQRECLSVEADRLADLRKTGPHAAYRRAQVAVDAYCAQGPLREGRDRARRPRLPLIA